MDKVAEKLIEIGMAPEAVHAYIQLLVRGPLKASELAQAAGVTRQRVYRLAAEMSQDGLVAVAPGRPRRFVAAAPQALVGQLRSRLELQARLLETTERDLVAALARMRAVPGAPPGDTDVLVVQGRWSIIAEAQRMYRAARASIDKVFTHAGGLPLLAGTGSLEILAARARAGVQVRLVLHESEFEAASQPGAIPPGIQVRYAAGPPGMVMSLVDRAEALQVMSADPLRRGPKQPPVALWTAALDYAELQATLFERLWESLPRRRTGAAAPEPSGAIAPRTHQLL
jgi:DNA-binding MarR family transcriptional regulator